MLTEGDAKVFFHREVSDRFGETLDSEGPAESDDVWLPAPEGWENAEFTDFQGLGGFARAIFSSAQNYRDDTQSRLPSYRERIVQVRLDEDEGGLNLNMPEETIREIEGKGKKPRTSFSASTSTTTSGCASGCL